MLTVGFAATASKAPPQANTAAAADASRSTPFSLDPAQQAGAADSVATSTNGKIGVAKSATANPPTNKAGGKNISPQAAAAKPADGGLMAWLLSALASAQGGAQAEFTDSSEAGDAPAASEALPDTGGSSKSAPKGPSTAVAQALPSAAVAGDPPSVSSAMPASAMPAAADASGAASGNTSVEPATSPKAATHETVPAQAALPDTVSPQPIPLTADTSSAAQSFARTLAGFGADSTAPASPPASHLTLSPDHAEWPHTLADQVQWQLGHEVQEARLELHPRDLGSVQVQVRITADGAEVRFAASHPQAREALEAAMPQLRLLLSGDGLPMTQTHVGSQSSWQSQGQARHAPQQTGGNGMVADEDETPVARRVVRVGLVDDFA